MSAESPFEMKLANLFEAYADRAPVEVEARSLAHAIASTDSRATTLFGRTFMRPRWLVPVLLALLLLAALAAAAFVGSRLLLNDIAPYQMVLTAGPDLEHASAHPVVIPLSDTRFLVLGNNEMEQSSFIYDLTDGQRALVAGDVPSGEQGYTFLLSDGRVFALMYDGAGPGETALMFQPAFMLGPTAEWSSNSLFRQLPFGPGNETGKDPIFGVKPSAALLPDGRVLVAGGHYHAETNTPLLRPDALIFDPQTKTFTPTGFMSTPREGHSMATLDDGRVLVAGGYSKKIGHPLSAPELTNLNTAEIYDPATGTFAAPMTMPDMWGENISAVLPDGRVALFRVDDEDLGDQDAPGPFPVVVFEPRDNTFATLGFMLERPQTVTALRDGRVLLTGASYGDNQPVPDLPWARIFDPRTGELTSVGGINAAQVGAAALPDGDVVLAGGLAGPDREWVPWVQIFK